MNAASNAAEQKPADAGGQALPILRGGWPLPAMGGAAIAGGGAYLGLAPHLTTLTMYRYQLDALPETVRAAAESVITTGWTGVTMLAVATFMALLNRIRGA